MIFVILIFFFFFLSFSLYSLPPLAISAATVIIAFPPVIRHAGSGSIGPGAVVTVMDVSPSARKAFLTLLRSPKSHPSHLELGVTRALKSQSHSCYFYGDECTSQSTVFFHSLCSHCLFLRSSSHPSYLELGVTYVCYFARPSAVCVYHTNLSPS